MGVSFNGGPFGRYDVGGDSNPPTATNHFGGDSLSKVEAMIEEAQHAPTMILLCIS